MEARDTLYRIRTALTRPLPEGGRLPDAAWRRRHRAMTLLLAVQAAALVAAAHVTGSAAPAASIAFWSVVAATTAVALAPRLRRAWRTGAVATGLVACSAFLVHLTGGMAEAHFHLFVMVSLIALYQDWLPFLVAFGAVGVHHTAVGLAAPERVFGDGAGSHPLAWVGLHLGFLLAAAVVNVVAWGLGERERQRAELVLDATADGVHGIDTEGRITFANAALAAMLGTTPEALLGRDHHVALGHRTDEEGSCPVCSTIAAGRGGPGVTARLRTPNGADLPVECAAAPLWEKRAVTGAVVTLRDLSERERLAQQALHDPLTGLANRTLLRAHLDHAVAALDRRRQPAALLFCDLDRFKDVNDRLGHAAGDALLLATAERLQTAVRGHDTVARFGGDEFVVLCTELPTTRDVMRIAQRLADAISDPVVIDGEAVQVSASIGVTVFDHPGTDIDELLEEADLAMYRAKERGRARVEAFDDELRERATRRLRVEADLRRAIDADELEVHYQPKVGLADGRLDGVEALVRWHHPDLGLLQPEDFLPIAEDAGLMPELGQWVLREACRQVRAWRARHPQAADLALAVNLSASQVRDPQLPEMVADTLAAVGLPPSSLCLEVNELALVDDTPSTVETLHALKRVGVRLAVDDFGTGWSSLSYLSRVPIDVLKVDRSFVATLDEPGDSWSIVAAAIGLSRSLGLAVVAEGVEQRSQADALRELGYELAQGYHFHEPLPPAELEALLAARPPRVTLGPGRSSGYDGR